MNVPAGRLDKRISIRSQSASRDALNQKILTWTEIANGAVWAHVAPVRASESFAALANQQKLSHRVTIRYRSDVTPDMRLFYGARQLAITGIRNPDERGEYLEITCIEGNHV
ncbi:MAG: phage head closure protein [Rhodocyclaceae bacterium]|nr:phage head closure protein [Rhodocyclaceae bacterium]